MVLPLVSTFINRCTLLQEVDILTSANTLYDNIDSYVNTDKRRKELILEEILKIKEEIIGLKKAMIKHFPGTVYYHLYTLNYPLLWHF